jgi:ankyrin repeat protein
LRLHTAVWKGSVDMAKQALAEGADVNLRIKQGSTALHWAAALGRKGLAELLLDHGADVNTVDELGWTPVFLAANEGFGSIVALLLERGAKRQATINGREAKLPPGGNAADDQLVQATEGGDVKAAKAAIEAGANVNCVSGEGWTPLLSAVNHDPQLTELLLTHGADPNVASNHGYTPLMRATDLGKSEVARLLLAAGADSQVLDSDGKTKTPRLDSERISVDLFALIGARPLAENVKSMFNTTRGVVGGRISIIDLIYENRSMLMNVPIRDERHICIPCDYARWRVQSVALPDRERQLRGGALWTQKALR